MDMEQQKKVKLSEIPITEELVLAMRGFNEDGTSKSHAILRHKKESYVPKYDRMLWGILEQAITKDSDVFVNIKEGWLMVLVEFPSKKDENYKAFKKLLKKTVGIEYDRSRKLDITVVEADGCRRGIGAKVEQWAFDDCLPMITFYCKMYNAKGILREDEV